MEAESRPSLTQNKDVVIIAGEASGDFHGAMLVKEMRALDPTLRFCGIGGDRMKDGGVVLSAHANDLAVVGLTEVLPKLGVILGARRKIKNLLKQKRPGLLILIDFPDFNMPLARVAHGLNIPVFYYISPQVWAWRKKRIHFLEQYVDRMAVILPFEEELYRTTKLDARFVGHPLLDSVLMPCSRDEALRRLGLHSKGTIIGLLPGSREREIESLLPCILKAAQIISRRIPDVQFVLPLAEAIPMKTIDEIRRDIPLDLTVVKGRFYEALGVSDGAIVASGTSTLEAALLGVPMVIVYRVSFLSYVLGKMFITVEHVGLVNIIAGREVVPEYIQANAEPGKIAQGLMDILTGEGRREKVSCDLKELKALLGEPGAAAKTAAMALELMEQGAM
ncbi:MAG TPA: lipid-A-disaccharide synthase, partial [Synergistetes bacterium]|nr:lipid-A-disaccharide synthase [Synergistota bacterium]